MYRIRVYTLLALFVVTLFGLLAKAYPGPGREFVNHWGPASVAYETFFMLLTFLLIPRRNAIIPIAITVCLVTSALEFLQLWQPAWLQAVRSTSVGGTLLGNTFSWWDIPAYLVGCLLGCLLLHWIVHRSPAT